MKYSTEGEFQWNRHLDGGIDHADSFIDLSLAQNGDVVAAGYAARRITSDEADADFVTARFDRDGTLMWDRYYDKSVYDVVRGLAVDHLGNTCVVGDTGRVATIRYDVDGTPSWLTQLPTTNSSYAADIVVDGAGRVTTVGRYHPTEQSPMVVIRTLQVEPTQ